MPEHEHEHGYGYGYGYGTVRMLTGRKLRRPTILTAVGLILFAAIGSRVLPHGYYVSILALLVIALVVLSMLPLLPFFAILVRFLVARIRNRNTVQDRIVDRSAHVEHMRLPVRGELHVITCSAPPRYGTGTYRMRASVWIDGVELVTVERHGVATLRQ